MPDLIGAEFDRYLRGREPETFDEATAAFSGSNPAMARAIAGVEGGTRPREMTAEQRRAYNNALRQVARWRNTTGERRRPGATARSREAVTRLRAAAQRQSSRRRADEVRRHGLSMRLRAAIRVSRVWKVHTMPADVGGRPRFVHMDELGAAVDAWQRGDLDEAGGIVLAAFFDSYWGAPDPAEMGEIEFVEFAR